MYDYQNLPPVIDGSAGHLIPNPEGTTAACVAPVDVDLPYPAGWGQPAGATMPVRAGEWVSCLGPNDSYRNDEFRDTCSLTGVILDPEQDKRAATLASFWKEHGLAVLVVESRKVVGAIVVGEVAPEAVGSDMETAEGPITLRPGHLVVLSPRRADRPYTISPESRKKRYADDGRVFDGELPEEFR